MQKITIYDKFGDLNILIFISDFLLDPKNY
jgi:hypothetical protein